MKTKTYLLAVIASLTIITSKADDKSITPSSNYITKKVDVPTFSSINSTSIFDIEFTQSPIQSVSVYAPDNLMEYVKVSVEDGELNIKFNIDKSFNFRHQQQTKLIVSAPNVTKLKSSGTGNIIIRDNMTSNDNISMQTSGTGNVSINNINCNDLKLITSGTGSININGKIIANEASLSTTGTGSINGKISADKISLSTTGTGYIKADVNATSLTCNANGMGSIAVTGRCNDCNISKGGMASVSQKGLKCNNVHENNSRTNLIRIR